MVDVNKLLGFDRFEKVFSRFIKDPIKIIPDQCYTYRDKSYKCEKCVKICHSDSLLLEDHSIKFIESRCDGCGLCHTICPTGAFLLSDDSKLVLRKIKHFLETEKKMICKCINTRNEEESEENASAFTTVCLGRLDESIILGAAALGAEKIWLDSSACETCEYGAKPLIETTLKNCRDILTAFDNSIEIHFSAKPPANFNTEKGTDLTSLEKGSRRDFFANIGKSLMGSGRDLVGERVDKIMESLSPSEKTLYNSNLPEKRAILLLMMNHLGNPKEELPDANSLFTDIEISDGCVFCNNCTTFCPTSALSRTKKEKRGIEFTPANCVNCGLCEFVCPNMSLKLSGVPAWRELLADEKKILIEGNLYMCRKCQQYFESKTPANECHACELRRKKLGDDSWY